MTAKKTLTANENRPVPEFVLRTASGKALSESDDLITANQLAREKGTRVLVYKRTAEGEVLMSRTGPGKWVRERDL